MVGYSTGSTIVSNKAQGIIFFEFKNLNPVASVLDLYRCCWEPHHQKRPLFEYIFTQKTCNRKQQIIQQSSTNKTRLFCKTIKSETLFCDDVRVSHRRGSFKKTKWFQTIFNWYYGYDGYNGTKGYDGYDSTKDMTSMMVRKDMMAMMVQRIQWL